MRKRLVRTMHWVAPGIGLILIPKCPVCLAAYIAIGTGVAVSFSVAEALRVGLLLVCAAALVWLAVNAARRAGRR